jgi:hypothetical protein
VSVVVTFDRSSRLVAKVLAKSLARPLFDRYPPSETRLQEQVIHPDDNLPRRTTAQPTRSLPR